jgi:hypothetical protein
MSTAKQAKPFRLKHKDGTLWAKGQTIGDLATGFWVWFRKDGSRMRSGYFDKGSQTGKWTTYDRTGSAVKVTEMKPKAGKVRTRIRKSTSR